LLISIDGMHALDYANCANGIAGINGGAPCCPNLAALGAHGAIYTQTSTSKPSDSFPGLTALATGGSPRSTGAFYDVSYDRALSPPPRRHPMASSAVPRFAPVSSARKSDSTKRSMSITPSSTPVAASTPHTCRAIRKTAARRCTRISSSG
jgi:hypothetical protein